MATDKQMNDKDRKFDKSVHEERGPAQTAGAGANADQRNRYGTEASQASGGSQGGRPQDHQGLSGGLTGSQETSTTQPTNQPNIKNLQSGGSRGPSSTNR